MNSVLRNQQAMASAQAAYDNALPVDDLDFLDGWAETEMLDVLEARFDDFVTAMYEDESTAPALMKLAWFLVSDSMFYRFQPVCLKQLKWQSETLPTREAFIEAFKDNGLDLDGIAKLVLASARYQDSEWEPAAKYEIGRFTDLVMQTAPQWSQFYPEEEQ